MLLSLEVPGSSSSSSSTSSRSAPGAPSGGHAFNFHVEDTSERCYRDVIAYLLQRGGKRVPYRGKQSSKLEKRRLPTKNLPLVLFTLNEKDIDFAELEAFQITNHFEGIGQLTTKRGYCELLREMPWLSQDPQEIAPRCYNLGDPLHREEFIEDFKLSAATMILRCVLKAFTHGNSSSSSSSSTSSSTSTSSSSGYHVSNGVTIPHAMIHTCLAVCLRYLRIKRGEWPGVERTMESLESETGQINLYLTEGPEWTAILQTSYALAEQGVPLQITDMHASWRSIYALIQSSKKASGVQSKEEPLILRIWLALKALQSFNRQFGMDGYKNIWVVKAPDACRGLGLKVLYRLEDILECERGMGGRTVQKYVENPLLAPLQSGDRTHAHASPPRSPSRHGNRASSSQAKAKPSEPAIPQAMMMKFDLRVWVVVTSFEPLQAHVYPRVYGRRCGSPYDDSIKTLGDSLMHLTNYSIQRKSAGPESNADSNNNNNGTANTDSKPEKASVRRLRNVCDSFRSDRPDARSAPAQTKEQTREQDLLVPHDEILKVVNNPATGNANAWEERVWPAIKRKIHATLEATRGCITPRERSFEFLGYDVIIDADLTPWILEVNMSPAMAHRSPQQSALIADMVEGLMRLAIIPSTGELEKVDKEVPFCADFFDRGDEFDRGFTDAYMDLGPVLGPFGASPTSSSTISSTQMGQCPATVTTAPTEQEVLIWEPLADVTPCVRRQEPFVTTAVKQKPIALQSRFISEWSDAPAVLVTPAAAPPTLSANSVRPRPKSANLSVRPSSGAGFSFAASASRATGTAIDVSFALVGRAITLPSIDWHDSLCTNYGKLLLLQSWAQASLVRLRRYHERRRVASTSLQAHIRGFLGKCVLFHLRRFRAARRIQCVERRRTALAELVYLRRRRAATRIQSRVRVVLAKMLTKILRRNSAASRLQCWTRHIFDVWRRKAAFKIVIAARSWLAHRRYNARIVFHLVALYYRRRFRAAKQIQLRTRRHLVRQREMKRLRRLVAECAARRGRELHLTAIERQKAWDQAVSVKLEIIVYNEIYAMATEMAVECYSLAVEEAAEEEAVQAAAEEEMRLAREAEEAANLAANPISPGTYSRNYTELLRQFDLESTSLPFGSNAMRSPGLSSASGCAVMTSLSDFVHEYNQLQAHIGLDEREDRGGNPETDLRDEKEDKDTSSALQFMFAPSERGIRPRSAPSVRCPEASQSSRQSMHSSDSPPLHSSELRQSAEAFPGMQHVHDYQSLQAQKDRQRQLLNLFDAVDGERGNSGSTYRGDGLPPRSKSAQGTRGTARAATREQNRPPAAPAQSASYRLSYTPSDAPGPHPPTTPGQRGRARSSSATSTRPSSQSHKDHSSPSLHTRFPKHVRGNSAQSSAHSTTITSATDEYNIKDRPAKKIKKKKSKASATSASASGTAYTSASAASTGANARRVYMPAPWEEDFAALNPYAYPDTHAPSLSSYPAFPSTLREQEPCVPRPSSSSASASAAGRYRDELDYRALDTQTKHETQRSILLHSMLSSLLQQSEHTHTHTTRGPSSGVGDYYEEQYNFSSTSRGRASRLGR